MVVRMILPILTNNTSLLLNSYTLGTMINWNPHCWTRRSNACSSTGCPGFCGWADPERRLRAKQSCWAIAWKSWNSKSDHPSRCWPMCWISTMISGMWAWAARLRSLVQGNDAPNIKPSSSIIFFLLGQTSYLSIARPIHSTFNTD